ncbi:MAG: hypothetical protein HGB08_02430 [Candidatus Moranbacteria bacterium]|nr:hypothetical protein [Candidatus Moranbacteria bacterium]
MMNRRPIDGEQLVISPCLPGCVVSQADLVSSIKGMGFLAAGQLHAEALLETGVPEEWKMFTLFFAGTLWTPRDQMFETIFIPIITHHGGRAEIGFHRSSCPVGPESRIVLTSNKIM